MDLIPPSETEAKQFAGEAVSENIFYSVSFHKFVSHNSQPWGE